MRNYSIWEILSMSAAGLVVSPSAIAKYGTAVGEQQGQLQRIHDTLDSAHVPAHAFGKLPEAGGLYRAYAEHAEEVLDITKQLPSHIGGVAEGLLDTARSYSGLEDGMAQGIREALGSGPGGSGSAPPGLSGGAGQVIGGIGNVVNDGYQAYGWMCAPETGLPALAVANLSPTGNWLTSGITEAVDWIMQHVPELSKLLDDVTGDVHALNTAAETWHSAGTRMNAVIAEMKQNARKLPATWSGQASESFGTFMGNVTRALEILVSTMGQTQKILQEAAAEADFAFQTISTIVTEVVEWVAGNILVDVVTAGLATGVEALASGGFIADKLVEAEQAASKLASVLRVLERVLKTLRTADLNLGYKALKGAEGLDKVKAFLSLGKTFRDDIKLGKVVNFRVFGKGMLASMAKFAVDAGRHGPNMEEETEAAKIGKSALGTRIGANVTVSAAEALTGLPVGTGKAALAKDEVKGLLKDVQDNGQGAAAATGQNDPSGWNDQRRQIESLISPPQEPREEK